MQPVAIAIAPPQARDRGTQDGTQGRRPKQATLAAQAA